MKNINVIALWGFRLLILFFVLCTYFRVLDVDTHYKEYILQHCGR